MNTTQFPIESGVPVAPHAGRRLAAIQYPFAALEVGQSFFIPADQLEERRTTARIVNRRLFAFLKKNPNKQLKFATRAVDGGVRVWRIA